MPLSLSAIDEILPPFAAAEGEAGERLDRVLARHFAEISRARFQALIADGRVSVEGKVETNGARKLRLGDRVAATLPPAVAAEPEPEAIALEIVHEDGDLIVINKPPGLVVHPAAGHETGTLVNALLAHCGDSLSGIGGVRRPGIVHRLDKDTSGLLVVAKNDRAHQGLSDQFAAHGRDGLLERAYQAVVWGHPEKKKGMINVGIARSLINRQKMSVSNAINAREAVTHYDTLEQFGAAALLECQLETGRTHQIRVHMAHIGHPLLGDETYAKGFKTSAAKLSDDARVALKALGRQALHAWKLGFQHPVSGEMMSFASELPEDMAKLLAALRARD